MPPQATGAYNAVKEALSIFSPFNKTGGGDSPGDGVDVLAEYRLEMPETELIALKNEYKQEYAQYYGGGIKQSQEKSYNYWLGKQTKDTVEDMLDANRSMNDNECWTALETFLPLATRSNPEPVVAVDQSMGDQTLADLIRNVLSFQSDRQKLRMLLRASTRDWAINKIGVIKVRWDTERGDICSEVKNPKMIRLDPDGYVQEGGVFMGAWIEEDIVASASLLIKLFPKERDFLLSKSGGKKGTKLTVEMWWMRDDDGGWRSYFYCLGDHILGKFKSNLWNYDGGTEEMPIPGMNHLELPASPYLFVGGIYSTRKQPHDDTTPFEQSISVQDVVNRRFRQIDKNAESTNNGIVVNGNLNSEQAALAAEAVRKGGAIRIPDKNVDVRTAIMRLPAPPLAGTVYNNLQDSRQLIQQIWGIAGSTPQGVDDTDTVRGKILVNQLDSSRIGGGVTGVIEQIADSWYNLVLQIMYVYYDVPHFAAAIGQYGAQELVQLKNTDLQGKIMVTVKEGSMVPKDPMTMRNQAVDLWGANGIDPISLGKYLEMPDPYEYAKNLLIWQLIQKGAVPPQMLFPDFAPPAPPGAPAGAPPAQGGMQGAQANVQNAPPELVSNEAVGAQSSQLLKSVSI